MTRHVDEDVDADVLASRERALWLMRVALSENHARAEAPAADDSDDGWSDSCSERARSDDEDETDRHVCALDALDALDDAVAHRGEARRTGGGGERRAHAGGERRGAERKERRADGGGGAGDDDGVAAKGVEFDQGTSAGVE